MEHLDLSNVIEIQQIRELLLLQPDLLSMFEMLLELANKKLNEEDEKRFISR